MRNFVNHIFNFKNEIRVSYVIITYLMKNINLDIAQNFSKFERLLGDKKHTTESQISLDKTKPNRHDINYAEMEVEHTELDDKITLIIESKKNNHKDFKFKLRCPSLSQTPFFRYDSDGPTHFNRNSDVPLIQQMITTPHFNSFDNAGRNIAYKTDKLLDEKEAKALEDLNFSFIHFCFESNLRYPLDDFTSIKPTPDSEFSFEVDRKDILSNLNFVS